MSSEQPAFARRSSAWFGDLGKNGLIARSHLRALGISAIADRPVIGICNTASQLNPCNSHLGLLAAAVRRGIEQAGAVALEFPIEHGERRPGVARNEGGGAPAASLLVSLVIEEDSHEGLHAREVDGVILGQQAILETILGT
jgi:dihydroxyacid dehydratase/phosphogluconate dehydratase